MPYITIKNKKARTHLSYYLWLQYFQKASRFFVFYCNVRHVIYKPTIKLLLLFLSRARVVLTRECKRHANPMGRTPHESTCLQVAYTGLIYTAKGDQPNATT